MITLINFIRNLNKLRKLRAWVKSKTLKTGGAIAVLAGIDASFFQGDIGMFCLQVFLTVVNAVPYVSMTAEQGISTIMFIVGTVMAALRANTHKDLDDRAED